MSRTSYLDSAEVETRAADAEVEAEATFPRVDANIVDRIVDALSLGDQFIVLSSGPTTAAPAPPPTLPAER